MQIKILHIDDEKGAAVTVDGVCEDLQEDVVTEWVDNFEGGTKKLRQNPFSYNGIILDAKCFLNDGKEDANEQYITRAILDIENIFREYRIKIPYCILSGFKEKIEGFIKAHNIDAFDKDGQEKDAVNYIVTEQTNVTSYLFEQEFPDLLPLTEMGFLHTHDATTLLQLFEAEKMRTSNKGLIKSRISQTRPLLSRIFLGLNKLGSYDGQPLVPDNYIKENGTEPEVTHVTNCAKYLSGMNITINGEGDTIQRKAIMPRYVSWQCSAIYNIASPTGNHVDSYNASKNTLSSIFYSLIDVLYWYRGFIIKFQKERNK